MSNVFTMDKTVEMNRITLERSRKAFSLRLGSTAWESFEIRTQEDMFMGKLIEASFDVLRDKIHEDHTAVYFDYKTPKTWIDQLKKEYAPKWLKKRYPVQYTVHRLKRTATFKRYAEYPKANIAIPKNNDRLFIETLGGLEVIRDKVTA